jgi:hypothetical protein
MVGTDIAATANATSVHMTATLVFGAPLHKRKWPGVVPRVQRVTSPDRQQSSRHDHGRQRGECQRPVNADQAAGRVLTEKWGEEALLTASGASIPIVVTYASRDESGRTDCFQAKRPPEGGLPVALSFEIRLRPSPPTE